MRHYQGTNFDFEDYDSFDDYSSYSSYKKRQISHQEKWSVLSPLLKQLRETDRAKREILDKNVSMNKLRYFQELLNNKIILESYLGDGTSFSLSKPKDIDFVFYEAGLYDINLDIRRSDFQFPAYYLGEGKRSYFKNYGVITTEFYSSYDYPISDPRFVRLMYNGHEMQFIRLAPYRDKTLSLFNNKKPEDWNNNTDKLLKDIGDFFLQGAWHEDQEIGWIVSNYFGLKKFRRIMELLYFNLGTDFSLVRKHISPLVKQFFEEVYPQPALVQMLKYIEECNSYEYKELENQSRTYYGLMNQLFSEFLQTPIDWGVGKVLKNIPLYKILFANLSRIYLLDELKNELKIREACYKLETFADEAITAVLNLKMKNLN